MKKISLLVPTRKRPDNIKKLVDSVISTKSDNNLIDFYFYIDDDDLESNEMLEKIKLGNNINIVILKCNSGENYNRWWNYIWKKIENKYDYFMQCGDDLIFKTKNWDIKVVDEFEKFKDRMVLVYCNDDSGSSYERATHPFLSKEWCSLLGYFTPILFDGAFNDTWLTEIGKMANRFVHLEDVHIEHLHPDFNKSNIDYVYLKQRQMCNQQNSIDVFEKTKNIRELDVKKIVEYIKEFKGD